MKPKKISIPSGSGEANRSLNVVSAGSGQPILFIHGFPLDHSMWRNQYVLSNQFHIIVPDLAGFGDSGAATSPMSMNQFADDLNSLLEALEVSDPVAVCGLSMGGYIGWQFAKHHSKRMSHLIACDTRAANDSSEIARARSIAAEGARNNGSGPVADAMVEKLIYQHDQAEQKDLVGSVHEVISKTDPESIAQGHLAMAVRPDSTSWLNEISVPALFIVGENDEITPPAEMQSNAQSVPGSQFVEIQNAGHLPPLENSNGFNTAVRQFLLGE